MSTALGNKDEQGILRMTRQIPRGRHRRGVNQRATGGDLSAPRAAYVEGNWETCHYVPPKSKGNHFRPIETKERRVAKHMLFNPSGSKTSW